MNCNLYPYSKLVYPHYTTNLALYNNFTYNVSFNYIYCYTDEAGLCLASLAQNDGTEYILVTAGANGNHGSQQYNIDDAYAVYNKLGK